MTVPFDPLKRTQCDSFIRCGLFDYFTQSLKYFDFAHVQFDPICDSPNWSYCTDCKEERELIRLGPTKNTTIPHQTWTERMQHTSAGQQAHTTQTRHDQYTSLKKRSPTSTLAAQHHCLCTELSNHRRNLTIVHVECKREMHNVIAKCASSTTNALDNIQCVPQPNCTLINNKQTRIPLVHQRKNLA